MTEATIITMKQLLEAGVHFGHQTKRWNPKMKPYIFGQRNGIYIIDLQKTVKIFKEAYNFVKERVGQGELVLFVGTKPQAQAAIVEEATRCGMPYVSYKWLGGMLTNFATIRKSVDKLKKLEEMQESGVFDNLPKKEVRKLEKEIESLRKVLTGIKNMEKLPGVLFVVDPKREKIAVSEARKLNIPVVGIVDTNCDPDDVDFCIPGNDDAIRAIKLFCNKISDAVLEGKKLYEERIVAEEKIEQEEGGMSRVEKEGEELEYEHYDIEES